MILKLLKKFHVPELPQTITVSDLINKIKIDKKQSVKGLYLVLLKKIGNVNIEQSSDVTEYIKGWLNHVRQK